MENVFNNGNVFNSGDNLLSVQLDRLLLLGGDQTERCSLYLLSKNLRFDYGLIVMIIISMLLKGIVSLMIVPYTHVSSATHCKNVHLALNWLYIT